ncbi:ABC transporter permease [Saccharospirillum sp. MSK14-1]|uniref:ABC transporter permease n=1 Tax=Saccharospirillum sp. MSK14-1 TaxID=1897632 RepID=UPI000D3D1CC4|nr:ABC transporter permease [Saccharospirillum sp. MSK14-1]PTY38767.1 ABC transporter permease [Saccharospirillum sp. MSK14-1]
MSSATSKRSWGQRLFGWLGREEAMSFWVTVAFFVLWELICRVSNIPVYFLPPPSVIVQTGIEFQRAIVVNSIQTLWTTAAGFGLAVVFGLILGIAIGWSRRLYRGLYPLMVGFNSVPKVALVPILVLWFGIGTVPAILTAFLISFFPIVVNVATGLATTEPEMDDVLRALGASKIDRLLKVGLPGAMPHFFGSLKVAITLAFVGSVISETVAANSGLGHMMLMAQANFEVPLVFAGLLALAFEGVVMYAIFVLIEQRMTGWAFRSQQ